MIAQNKTSMGRRGARMGVSIPVIVTALLFLASTVSNAQNSEWIEASSIRPEHQFTEIEVLENGNLGASLIHKSTKPTSSLIVSRSLGSSDFHDVWVADTTRVVVSGGVEITSLRNDLFMRGTFGYRRFSESGGRDEIVCTDTTFPNWIHPIDSATLLLTGSWGLDTAIGSNYATNNVVINHNNTTCTEVYSALPFRGEGFPRDAYTDVDGTPYFCLEQRGRVHEDTLVQTVDGVGVTIIGLDDPHKYDPVFLGRRGSTWVMVVKASSGFYQQPQILILDRTFQVLSRYEIEGSGQRIMETKLVDSHLVVCQSHHITIFDVNTGSVVNRSFEDVIGSHPVQFGQQFVDADLFRNTLYACIAEAIILVPNVITGVAESLNERGSNSRAIRRDEVLDLPLAWSGEKQSVRLYSAHGECRSLDIHTSGDQLRLSGTDLWPGYNLVVFEDRSISILCIP